MTSPSSSSETNFENAPSDSYVPSFDSHSQIFMCNVEWLQSAENNGIPIVDLILKRVRSRLRKAFGSAIPILENEPTNEQTPPPVPSRVPHTRTQKH
ncbi:hypothetical protein HAX54_020984 [Datura stramonium]|uniref:Uncharacterized protein n=1 Tax=Datura stramonium TaxID=4076 RepID=A0ABS8UUA5_DATST|nr:hypothetical protein [Datura stramonium]